MDSQVTEGPIDIGIVGAGTMGGGIAQVAAAAGHSVIIYDSLPDAGDVMRERIATETAKRVDAGKMAAGHRAELLARLTVTESLTELSCCGCVIEAVIESMEVKRALFRQLEEIVSSDAILATNTSSLSITGIGRGLDRPGRFVGMHFFNPVPAMKLVEVVHGLETDADTVTKVEQLALAWGKSPVQTASSPGFIVNRLARPFYAEALALLQEKRATPKQIDRAMRAARFRMGPCELMDLIGHDVNYAVTESIFNAYYSDRRFLPSQVQRELVEGGRLGRKSGRGFYVYPPNPEESPATEENEPGEPGLFESVSFQGEYALARHLHEAFTAAEIDVHTDWHGTGAQIILGSSAKSLTLSLTDGRPVNLLADDIGNSDIGTFDLVPYASPDSLCISFAAGCNSRLKACAIATLRSVAIVPTEIADAPGLVVARTLAMIVNEAADAVLHGICTPDAANRAMRLGVNYPSGPFEWLDEIGSDYFVRLLENLGRLVDSERYRVSAYLREKQWAGRTTANAG